MDPSWSCSQAVYKTVWHIPLLCVQWKTPDDGHRNCPKHVDFHGSILILLASCIRNCMTCTIAVCTVKNSWWWTEELPQICRFWFQNKFAKLVHLVGFIIKIFHDARPREIKKKLFSFVSNYSFRLFHFDLCGDFNFVSSYSAFFDYRFGFKNFLACLFHVKV
jgi:hypothetical protein